jgi:hypothetical protein
VTLAGLLGPGKIERRGKFGQHGFEALIRRR